MDGQERTAQARTRDVFLKRDDQPELARVARYGRLAFGEVDDVSEVLPERPDRILRAVELLRLHVSGTTVQVVPSFDPSNVHVRGKRSGTTD